MTSQPEFIKAFKEADPEASREDIDKAWKEEKQREDKRLAAEREDKRLAAEREDKRLAAEREEKRLAAEREDKRLAAEAEDKRLAAEREEKRLAAEREDKRLAAEAEREHELAKLRIEQQRGGDVIGGHQDIPPWFQNFQVEMKTAIDDTKMEMKTAIDDTKTAVEASSIMKAFANLNPWAQGPGSSRSERHDMAAKLKKYYGKIECMVVPSTKTVNVTGAHIWPLHAFPERMVELELDFDAVHHPRNGLFLTKGIEKAFDKLQVTFLLDKEGVFRLRVLDDKLAKVSIINYSGSQDKENWASPAKNKKNFTSIDGEQLVFPPDKPPYRRLLWLHAHWALRHMLTMQWEPVNRLAVQAEGDLSAMRKLSEANPFSKVDQHVSLELAFPWTQTASASSETSVTPEE